MVCPEAESETSSQNGKMQSRRPSLGEEQDLSDPLALRMLVLSGRRRRLVPN